MDGKKLIVMEGKITQEIHLPGISAERVEELGTLTYQAALRALCLKKSIQCAAEVEIIKIRLYYDPNRLGKFGEERPSIADFQIVFRPFLFQYKSCTSEKLQIMARWQPDAEYVEVSILDKDARPDGRYNVGNTRIKDIQSDALATVLIDAMQIGVSRWAMEIEPSLNWLKGVAKLLEPLTSFVKTKS